ncbi:MAG: VWA domain-containing protein [Candidatus Aminicenantes bacterium]|nr:VWA domain-containing protein [Candidatus Aminicenantes bacterium]
MKRGIVMGLLLMAVFVWAQEDHDVTVMNIAVPVRVMEGGQFVDNLTIEDFQVFEDGTPQTLDALYVIRNGDVARKEDSRDFQPPLRRHFILLFQLLSYHPRLADVVTYFFNNVYRPGDTLTIQTVQKSYNLSESAMELRSKEELAKDLINLIRKDTLVGSSAYNTLIRELRRIVVQISAGGSLDGTTSAMDGSMNLELLFPRYKENLEKLEEMRVIDDRTFIQFAQSVKKQPGRKYVFLFYEREFRPEINQSDLNRMASNYQDKPQIMSHLQDLFQLYSRSPSLDSDQISRVFGDSNITFNLMFINKEPEQVPGIYMREQSEDVYSAFSSLAKETGGIVDASMNPEPSFRKAVDSAVNYYILYYRPQSTASQGTYCQIRVLIPDKNYTVLHRPGYFR